MANHVKLVSNAKTMITQKNIVTFDTCKKMHGVMAKVQHQTLIAFILPALNFLETYTIIKINK